LICVGSGFVQLQIVTEWGCGWEKPGVLQRYGVSGVETPDRGCGVKGGGDNETVES